MAALIEIYEGRKLSHYRLERCQFVRFRQQEDSKTFHKLHVLEMNDYLWDEFREVGSETWKGCK